MNTNASQCCSRFRSFAELSQAIGVLALLVTACCLVAPGCRKREDLATRLAKEREDAAAKAPPSPTEFLEAAMRGDYEAVLAALERGMDVNAVDESGRTALQLASFDGFHEVVQLLLDRGATVDAVDAAGRSALMFASTASNIETVELLLEAGASVDLVDKEEHFTALMFAAAEGQIEVVRALIRAGAAPGTLDVDVESARDFAASKGFAEIVSLLDSLQSPPASTD